MYGDRLPPQSQEAEEAVIGSLLIDGDALLRVGAFLKPEDFALERTKLCYETCLGLFDRKEAINQVTLGHELQSRGALETMGGLAYLNNLVLKVPTSAHIEHYARIVHRTAMMRRLIQAAEGIAAIGFDAGPDVDRALTQAEELLYSLSRGEVTRDFIPLHRVLNEYLEEKRLLPGARADAPDVVPTGFIDMDKLLGGLQRSDLVILAARPSLGKSSLALNIAYNAAKLAMAHVAIFSLEMGKEQLADRLISGLSKLDTYSLRRLRQGRHAPGTEHDEAAVMPAIGELSELPIWIDDTPLLSVVEMRSKARRLHMEQGVDLVIVDYMQLMQPQGSFRNRNREQEMSEISRSLKALARDVHVPVLALSQLSRAVTGRPDHRPILTDLRDSGSIEQDADVVLFIHREDMLHREEDWEKLYPDRPYPRGVAEIILAKHRHGPIGTFSLYFDEKTTTFKNALVGAR